MPRYLNAVILLLLAGVSAAPVRGTLVVAVPVRDGLVVCADKRLYNFDARTYTDNNLKIRRAGDRSLFVATNTIGFYDRKTRSMAFNAFDVTEKYVAKNDLNSGKPFWEGLKKEITTQLRAYFAARPYTEWPESDRANNNLLFNLIFYSVRENEAFSHSLKVFYEKKKTPVIYIPDPVTEKVRTPKLSGKGREVMTYLARNPSAASDPAFQRFDEARFNILETTASDAVAFAGKLFEMTSAHVPQANVSVAFNCALLESAGGYKLITRTVHE